MNDPIPKIDLQRAFTLISFPIHSRWWRIPTEKIIERRLFIILMAVPWARFWSIPIRECTKYISSPAKNNAALLVI